MYLSLEIWIKKYPIHMINQLLRFVNKNTKKIYILINYIIKIYD